MRYLVSVVGVLAVIAGCSVGTEPNGSGAVGPIGPFPAGLTGKVAFATEVVVTTPSRAYIETKLHIIDVAHPVDSVIFTGRDLFVMGLTWAPDGEHVVMQTFAYQDPGPNGENNNIIQLHRLNAAGSENYVIFDGIGPEFRPAYGTDGRLAYFAGWSNDPSSGIYIDGTPVHSLDYDNADLAWMPDGTALVYTYQWWAGPPRGLVRLTLADSSSTQLVSPDTGEVIMHPAVSPDGARIAIMRYGGSRRGQEIWTVTATGADPRRLTNGFGDEFPTWTPGGKYIAFVRYGAHDHGIYVIAPEGGPPTRVVGVAAGVTAVAWSR
jgi:tricorn protease-like protein